MSRELATIDCEVPVEINFDEEPVPDNEKLVELFTELEFKSLIERLSKESEAIAELPSRRNQKCRKWILNVSFLNRKWELVLPLI